MIVKIGVIQLCSSLEYKENLDKIQGFIDEAINNNVKAIFLPECFYSMSDGRKATPYLINEGNDHYENIKNLALKNGGRVFVAFDHMVLPSKLPKEIQGHQKEVHD